MSKRTRSPVRKIAITSGDQDGIGLEVSLKALNRLGPVRGVQFVLYKSKSHPKFLNRLYLQVRKKFSPHELEILDRADTPAHWVEHAALLCNKKDFSAMATAPLSKSLIYEAGFKAMGHTDILKHVSGAQDVFMAFIGSKFNVLLATGHHPLASVSSKLNLAQLNAACSVASTLAKALSPHQSKRPLALLGLNPHAGEDGLIGSEEKNILLPCTNFIRSQKINIHGPLVPDTAFIKSNWQKYSMYICLYHDQGLIPFKMAHGLSGVHISAGLPFIRTSVDHGTAKDIFGKNIADPISMIEALKWADKLSRGENRYGA